MTDVLRVGYRPLVFLISIILAGWLLANLEPVLMPFIVGALFAYLGDPVADRLENLGLSRTSAVCICFLVIIAVIAIFLLLVVPTIVHQVKVLYGFLPDILNWLQKNVVPWLHANLGIEAEDFNVQNIRQEVVQNWGGVQKVMKDVLAGIGNSTGSFVAFLANLAIVPVVGFYLLRDWDVIMEKILKLLPGRYQQTTHDLAAECDDVVGAFFKGQLWVMTALAVIYGFGLWLVGLKLAFLIGLFAGLASIVPYLGAALGIIAALVAGVFQFGMGWELLLIGVVFGVGQAIESMILTPILVGDKIGLHPVAVIFAIMAGGQLFGFIGVLVALPVAAVIAVLLRHAHDFYKDSDTYTES